MQRVTQNSGVVTPIENTHKQPSKTSNVAAKRFTKTPSDFKRTKANPINFTNVLKTAFFGFLAFGARANASRYSGSNPILIANNTGTLGHPNGAELYDTNTVFAWPNSLSGRVEVINPYLQPVMPQISIPNFGQTTVIPHALTVGGFIVSGVDTTSGKSKAGFQIFNSTYQPSSPKVSLHTIISGNQTSVVSTMTETHAVFCWYDPTNINGPGIYQRLFNANKAFTPVTNQETQVVVIGQEVEPILFNIDLGYEMLYVDKGNITSIEFTINGNKEAKRTVNTNAENICVCPCGTLVDGTTYVVCFAKVDANRSILGYYFRLNDGNNYINVDQPIITGSLGTWDGEATLIDVRSIPEGFVVTFLRNGAADRMIFSKNGTVVEGETNDDLLHPTDISGVTRSSGWGALYKNASGIYYRLFKPTIETTTMMTTHATGSTTPPLTTRKKSVITTKPASKKSASDPWNYTVIISTIVASAFCILLVSVGLYYRYRKKNNEKIPLISNDEPINEDTKTSRLKKLSNRIKQFSFTK